jgi:hypothetical protein
MRRSTRIELATPMGVGAILGLSAGIVTGIMAGMVGALVGLCVGSLVGLVAGTAMLRDEGHRAARGRELDQIIGVSGGDMGAAPVSIPPTAMREAREAEESSKAWMAEWLTPPPPVAG